MNDYILRSDAIEALKKAHNPNVARFAISKSAIDTIPAADVQPMVRGAWRYCGADRWNDAYECSCCGKISINDSCFCPNCGADMRGEKDER